MYQFEDQSQATRERRSKEGTRDNFIAPLAETTDDGFQGSEATKEAEAVKFLDLELDAAVKYLYPARQEYEGPPEGESGGGLRFVNLQATGQIRRSTHSLLSSESCRHQSVGERALQTAIEDMIALSTRTLRLTAVGLADSDGSVKMVFVKVLSTISPLPSK